LKGQTTASASERAGAGASSEASCWRIARSSSWIPRLGSRPSGLAAAAIEGEHQLAAQPFLKWVGLHERLELGDDLGVATEREVGVDAVHQRSEPELLEPTDLRLREVEEGEIGERRPAPERERLAQPDGGLHRVAVGECTTARLVQALEECGVELFRSREKQVSARTRDEDPVLTSRQTSSGPRSRNSSRTGAAASTD
jgi:hypothetical protein